MQVLRPWVPGAPAGADVDHPPGIVVSSTPADPGAPIRGPGTRPHLAIAAGPRMRSAHPAPSTQHPPHATTVTAPVQNPLG